MTLRRFALVAAATVLAISTAAADERVTTENFEVSAPTKQLAEAFAKRAEEFRKEKAEEAQQQLHLPKPHPGTKTQRQNGPSPTP